MGMESLEKRLMKLLITLILVGALFTALVAYSNSKSSNTIVNDKTVIEKDHSLKRKHPKNNDIKTNCLPNK